MILRLESIRQVIFASKSGKYKEKGKTLVIFAFLLFARKRSVTDYAAVSTSTSSTATVSLGTFCLIVR
jgi:hypothetical protein